MNHTPFSREMAHQIMARQFGVSRDPEALASAAMRVYTQMLTNLFNLLGQTSTSAIFRRSLILTRQVSPCLSELEETDHDNLLEAVGACVRKQSPEIAREVSIALLETFLELLMTLIGESLTRQLIQEAGLDRPPPSEESPG